MTAGVVLGISGWFTPHNVLYHEDGRTIGEVAADGWINLLAHADATGFFEQAGTPQSAPRRPAGTPDIQSARDRR